MSGRTGRSFRPASRTSRTVSCTTPSGRADNVRERMPRPGEVIYWSLDFNVDPMTSVVCQIEDHSTVQDLAYGRRQRVVSVVDEIVLPNSNTAAMCEAFAARVRSWGPAQPYTVRLYGDAAGSARSTVGHSDYEIVRQFFRTQPEFKVTYHVKSSNPAVRDRVNA